MAFLFWALSLPGGTKLISVRLSMPTFPWRCFCVLGEGQSAFDLRGDVSVLASAEMSSSPLGPQSSIHTNCLWIILHSHLKASFESVVVLASQEWFYNSRATQGHGKPRLWSPTGPHIRGNHFFSNIFPDFWAQVFFSPEAYKHPTGVFRASKQDVQQKIT